jgi:hypothetical protein
MSFSHLPPSLTSTFHWLAAWLQRRTAVRLPLVLCGLLFAKGRRTVTSWFRAAGITTDFRPAYYTVCVVGQHTTALASTVLSAVRPRLPGPRLRVALDDTPTARYGPCVEGAGIHHNPTPGPAGAKHLYGHVWVTLAALAQHPDWGMCALPLQAQLYIRQADVERVPAERRPPFRTKLQLAAEQLRWLRLQVGEHYAERWAVVDGAYAKRPFLRPARQEGFVVVSRLRKDAALWSVPKVVPPGQRGRGQPRKYGPERLSLAKRAGHPRGWQKVVCVQYSARVTKRIKTFLATWRPAGGVIRVVLVQEADGWLPFFCTKPEATPEEILEAMADRGALEQTFKEVKEVWGAGQQQVRNVHSNQGCFNLNLWLYTLVEEWAWPQPEAQLVDRSASPWDSEPRRPSHADKRKALQREVLQGEIAAALSGRPSRAKIRALGQRLLDLVA